MNIFHSKISFFSEDRSKFREFESDASLLLQSSIVLFDHSNASLRQQEKIWGLTRLILISFKSNNYVFAHLLFLLVFIKNLHSELYKEIESSSLSLQELSDKFCQLIPADFVKYRKINIVYLQAILLKFYNNQNDESRSEKLYTILENGSYSCQINSSLDEQPNYSTLASCFFRIDQDYEYSRTPLSYLLKKINLTDTLNIQ